MEHNKQTLVLSQPIVFGLSVFEKYMMNLSFFLFQQKLKEYLEGRNLITKLQAKHDLLQKTLGESKSGNHLSLCHPIPCNY